MNISSLVEKEISLINLLLESVPFTPGAEPRAFFLDIYRLLSSEIKTLNLSEQSWEQHNQIAVNKLLKLSISFGNLIKGFQIDKQAHESRAAHQGFKRPAANLVDPFKDSFLNEAALPVPPYYVNFTKNLALILRNFDIGSALQSSYDYASPTASSQNRFSRFSQASKNSGPESDLTSANGSLSSGGATNSLIRLDARQLLIEKLEINIKLDALFTMKILFKLFRRMFLLLRESLGDYSGIIAEPQEAKEILETSSIFSSVSNTSAGVELVHSIEDYVKLTIEIINRVNHGIVDPFTAMLKREIVEPRVVAGFRSLVSTI